MKLLVWDEGIGAGGIERFTCAMLPRLAGLTERLVWFCPEHRHQDYRNWMAPGSTVELLSSTGAGAGLGPRLCGRLSRLTAPIFPRAARKLAEMRTAGLLRQAIVRTGATHLLIPALFDQPFPELQIPVYAVVCDINYHGSWKNECLDNLRRWARRAEGIICISDFTRQEVLGEVGSAPAQIVSIPIAADMPPSPERASFPVAAAVPVLLYPASFNVHKGHAVLLQSLLKLWQDGFRFRLVLTGGDTEHAVGTRVLEKPELEAARQVVAQAPQGFREAIEARGFVAPAALEALYAEATLVVLPSLYEGFGLPFSEALFRGKTVVCSGIPAFREQAERYAATSRVTFAEPGNVAEWQAVLRTALSTPRSPEPARAEIEAMAALWTWRHVAEAYFRFMGGTSPVNGIIR